MAGIAFGKLEARANRCPRVNGSVESSHGAIPTLFEKILGLFEEPLGDGIHVFVTHFAKFLEFLLLVRIEIARDLDLDPHQEVSLAMTLQVFDAAPANAKRGAGLRASGDANLRTAFERRHINRAAQASDHKGNWHFANEIVVLAVKNFMIPNV